MNSTENNQKGFIQIIVLLIVILVIAGLVGYSPTTVWNYISHVFFFVWGIITIIIEFLIELIRNGVDAVENIKNLF